MTRYSPIFIGLVLGIALGLLYAWVIQPIQIVESTPSTLRDDYRTDLILMIAEAYEGDHDLELALQRLELFNLEPPEGIVRSAFTYAQDHSYEGDELHRLSEFLADLETR